MNYVPMSASPPTTANINTGLGLTDDDVLARQPGPSADDPLTGVIGDNANHIVAVRIRKGNGNGADSTKYWGGDATKVAVDANLEEVTYTWTSKVHVSSATGSSIQAVAVPIDKFDTSDPSVTPGKGMWSGTSVLFDVDAERPNPPVALIDRTSSDNLATVIFGQGTSDPNDDKRHNVAGIGTKLEFDVKAGPGADKIGAVVDGKQTVELVLHSLKQNEDASSQIPDKGADEGSRHLGGPAIRHPPRQASPSPGVISAIWWATGP